MGSDMLILARILVISAPGECFREETRLSQTSGEGLKRVADPGPASKGLVTVHYSCRPGFLAEGQ